MTVISLKRVIMFSLLASLIAFCRLSYSTLVVLFLATLVETEVANSAGVDNVLVEDEEFSVVASFSVSSFSSASETEVVEIVSSSEVAIAGVVFSTTGSVTIYCMLLLFTSSAAGIPPAIAPYIGCAISANTMKEDAIIPFVLLLLGLIIIALLLSFCFTPKQKIIFMRIV